MLKQLTDLEFKKIIPGSIYTNLEYMNITGSIIEGKPVYFVFFRNGLPQVAFALFEKRNNIVVPKFYPLYSGVWLKGSLEHLNLRNDFFDTIKELKKKYQSIEICLPPFINDVRAFIWNGFDVNLKYTYVKDISDFNFKLDLLRNYKNAKKNLDLEMENDYLLDSEWLKYTDLLKKIGYNVNHFKELESWISKLESSNIIRVFYVKNSKGIIKGSSILLFDNEKKEAGLLFNIVPNIIDQSKINAYLYIELQKWLNHNGYLKFDYLGANFKNVADFKSRLNAELKMYFVVSYNSIIFKNLFLIFNIYLKKIKNRLRKASLTI